MASHKSSDVDEHRGYVTGELARLLDGGEWPQRAAHRLGYSSAESLQRLLERWGEPSLARRLTRERGGVWAA